MTDGAAAASAGLGDDCAREIPKLLTKDEIRELSRIDGRRFTAVLLIEIATIAIAVWVSETWWHPALYAVAALVIGTRFNAFGGLLHEAAHHRAYANRRLNDLAGEIAALPLTVSLAGYRASHFAHHRELNGERDPDWQRFVKLDDYRFPASRATVLRRAAGYLTGLKTPSALRDVNRDGGKIPASTRRARLAFFLALLAASVAFGFWRQLLLYWVVPLVTVFMAIRYVRSVAEHFGVEHEHVLNETRTVVAPVWELWIFAPWGLNYHLEHHLFPSVPFFRLGELHRILMTREPFASKAHITRGYFGGLLRECAAAAAERGRGAGATAPAGQ